MINEMVFRVAILNDAEQLDNLLTKLIVDERNYDKSIEPNFIVKDFYKNCIIKDNHMIYVCENDNVIVGYIYLIINKDKTAKIDALYVGEDYRNKGIASKLIDLAILYFKENNVKKIEISVLSENTKAKRIYIEKGFITFKETLKLEL